MKMNFKRGNDVTNFERFFNGSLHYFKFIGIDIQPKQSLLTKIILWLTVLNFLFVLVHQIMFFSLPDVTLGQIANGVGYINYTCVGLGKIFSMIYNRRALLRCYENLRLSFPSVQLQRQYNMENYLKIYTKVQLFLWNYFIYIFILYLGYPLVQSLYELWRDGVYDFKFPLFLWHPFAMNWLEYIIFYILQSLSSFGIGISILSCDLCLYSSVSQLCMQFDLLAHKISELEPENPNSLYQLKRLIEQHQNILQLAYEVNHIFTPSIIFSLIQSSFILCFYAFQVLNDLSFILILKVVTLLCYEMKQNIITCYFGNKLMDSSANIFDVLYMNDWYKGSRKYKETILFMMMCTRRPVTLNVAGITDISFVTLKQVLSISYQTFALLQSTKMQ